MDEHNIALLEKVGADRLSMALDKTDPEARKLALDEAMKVTDRQIELKKLEDARQDKLREEEIKKADSKANLLVHCAEIGVGLILAPVVDYFCKRALAKLCINFETHGSFTTTAGRALSGLFRFKK